jgi:hypothetical protein
MAHKGYTLNYFIDFFQSIPDHRWTEGTEHREGTVQKCAIGHAASDNRAPANTYGANRNARLEALQSFLGNKIAAINDGHDEYIALGATPRGRILRALRNRKRTGNILG